MPISMPISMPIRANRESWCVEISGNLNNHERDIGIKETIPLNDV